MTAGLWLFLFRFVTASLGRKPAQEPLYDPKVLLQQAQQEMRENQAKNRERAVQAITQKNNLQAELDKTQKIVERLWARAAQAAREEDPDLERQLLAEARPYQATLVRMQTALERSVKTVDLIKDAVRREEQHIRTRTAEAMAAQAEFAQTRIAASIEAMAEPGPPDPHSDHAKLEAVLKQMDRTGEVLWQEAQVALAAGDDTLAVRLLTEQQSLHHAVIFARRHA